MGAKSSFFKGLVSNQSIEKVPVFNKLLPQGDLGITAGKERAKGAFAGARADSRRARGYAKRAGQQDNNLAEAVAFNKQGLTSDDMLAAQQQAFTAKKNRYMERAEENAMRLEKRGNEMRGGVGDMIKGVGGYFAASDMRGMGGRAMTAAVRTGTAGAAYMGANAGLRYMSGGGLTYNNQGERDIAGIPFI